MPEWVVTIRVLLDIGIVTFLFYKIVMMLRETRAFELAKGVVVIVLMWGISKLFGLTTLEYVITQVLLYGVLGLMILFQPELRTALEKLGKNKWGSRNATAFSAKQILINDMIDACMSMSSQKIGALIVIEMKDNLQEYIDTGIELDGKVSPQFLENIFFPNAPLHDGAIFIRGNRVVAASGYLPLTDRSDIPKELGTRHRASIGVCEHTDAIVLVVSEETGKVSLVQHDQLLRPLDKNTLREELEKRMITQEDKKRSTRKSKGVKSKEVKNDVSE